MNTFNEIDMQQESVTISDSPIDDIVMSTEPCTQEKPPSALTVPATEEEEAVSHDEFSDEELDMHAGNKTSTPGRSVTLQMLLDAKILQPGEAAMTIEYLGQKFVGDLQADGKIKSHETETIFCSPSAWAIHCKRIINPDKKSGCGWASVKYRGKKLDAYKAAWLRRVQLQRDSTPTDDEIENETEQLVAPPPQRIVVKHNTVPNRISQHDANTLVEAVSFSSIGKVQPFLVSIGTNACFVLDLHCHLTVSEVCGYLAGSWDVNTHNLAVTHAFPCLTCKADDRPAVLVESQIFITMERMGLTLVGWYHSHPVNAAMPSLRDCDSQLEYQIRKRGPSDLTYTPCIGIICSPYNPESPVLESSLTCFWASPPPEQRPTEYPRPLLMQYAVVHDTRLAPHAMEQISKSIKYYASMIDDRAINFFDQYKTDITYLDKLKCTLAAKFPREQSDGLLWSFIRDALGCSADGDDKMDLDALLAVSQPIPKSQSGMPLDLPSSSALRHAIGQPSGVPQPPAYSLPGSGKFELQTHLNIPVPPGSNKLSSKNSLSSRGLDVLSGMSLGLGPATSVSLGLPVSAYDSLTAGGLLANLPPGISSSLAATLAKLPDSGMTDFSNLPSSGPGSLEKSGASALAASLASSAPPGLTPNLMLSSAEIANALFQSGKFPSASSLLGIPDPMSQSILDANNMYLSPSLLKMQDGLGLLRPVSSGSSSSKNNQDQSLYLKSTRDLMKSAKEFLPPDVNISALKAAGKMDFSFPPELSVTKQPDVSISTVTKIPKISDYASDFSMSAPKSGESFLNQMLELTKKAGKADFTLDSSESSAKINISDDYAPFNLSKSVAHSDADNMNRSNVTDFSLVKTGGDNVNKELSCDSDIQNLSMRSGVSRDSVQDHNSLPDHSMT